MENTENVAVMMTFHNADTVNLFEIALRSVEDQEGFRNRIRIYLSCDGPLQEDKQRWLTSNTHRFHRIFSNPEHRGHAACLNQIIDNLEDEAFAFRMDSDDVCSSDRFEKQISHMNNHPEVDLIGCQVFDIDEDGNNLGERSYPIDHASCVKYMMRMNPILHPTYCIRRSMLRNSFARYPTAFVTDDFAFILTLVKRGIMIGNCAERVFHWRLGENFYNRRSSFKRALIELQWWSSAVKHNKGYFTVYYLYPLSRFLLRLLPPGIQKIIYQSGLREKLGGLSRPSA